MFYPNYSIPFEYKKNRYRWLKKIDKFLLSGDYILGKYVRKFEKKMNLWIHSKKTSFTYHPISTSSGTDALKLILHSISIKGYEVIVSPYTFISVPTTILQLGGTPVFIDIHRDHYDINPSLLQKYLSKNSKNVKAIIFTHLFGFPSIALKTISSIHISYPHIFTIEDTCQSFYSSYKNQFLGSFSHFSFFSFFPSKIYSTCGDAGMIFSSSSYYSKILLSLRNHGIIDTKSSGYNARMDAFHALFLSLKWNSFLKDISLNRFLGEIYLDKFSAFIQKKPFFHPSINPVFPFFSIQIPPRKKKSILFLLKNSNIPFRIFYSKLFPQLNIYSSLFKIPFPLHNSYSLSFSQLSLPLSVYSPHTLLSSLSSILL